MNTTNVTTIHIKYTHTVKDLREALANMPQDAKFLSQYDIKIKELPTTPSQSTSARSAYLCDHKRGYGPACTAC